MRHHRSKSKLATKKITKQKLCTVYCSCNQGIESEFFFYNSILPTARGETLKERSEVGSFIHTRGRCSTQMIDPAYITLEQLLIPVTSLRRGVYSIQNKKLNTMKTAIVYSRNTPPPRQIWISGFHAQIVSICLFQKFLNHFSHVKATTFTGQKVHNTRRFAISKVVMLESSAIRQAYSLLRPHELAIVATTTAESARVFAWILSCSRPLNSPQTNWSSSDFALPYVMAGLSETRGPISGSMLKRCQYLSIILICECWPQ